MGPAWQAQPQVCDDGAGSSLIDLQRSPVIRTDDTIAGFLRFAGLSASCAQTVGRSPVLRGSGGFFSCSPWIKPKSTTGKPSPKAWKPRATPRAGFTFALVPLPMGSQTQCPTSQSSWEAVLPDSHLSEGLKLVSNDVPRGSKRR